LSKAASYEGTWNGQNTCADEAYRGAPRGISKEISKKAAVPGILQSGSLLVVRRVRAGRRFVCFSNHGHHPRYARKNAGAAA
jgi:hypothetical protein